MSKWKFVLASMGLSLCVAGAAMAQPQQPQQGQGRQRGNFDPAQARAQMMTRLKEQLGATDEEFTALQPKLEALMTAQRDAPGDGGGRGAAGTRGTRGGGNTRAD